MEIIKPKIFEDDLRSADFLSVIDNIFNYS